MRDHAMRLQPRLFLPHRLNALPRSNTVSIRSFRLTCKVLTASTSPRIISRISNSHSRSVRGAGSVPSHSTESAATADCRRRIGKGLNARRRLPILALFGNVVQALFPSPGDSRRLSSGSRASQRGSSIVADSKRKEIAVCIFSSCFGRLKWYFLPLCSGRAVD